MKRAPTNRYKPYSLKVGAAISCGESTLSSFRVALYLSLRDSERRKRAGVGAFGSLGLMFFLAVAAAGGIWFAYGYIPAEYYLPASLSLMVAVGIAAYVLLSRRVFRT